MAGINWKIGGQAGYGIMSTGKFFAKICLRHHWYVFCYTEYPSLIRGGHNTYQVHAGREKIYSHKQNLDVLVALDETTVTENSPEIANNGILIYDPEKIPNLKITGSNFALLAVPMNRISKEICGSELMKDTVALGASVAIYHGDLEILNEIIKEEFKEKGEDIINKNIRAAKTGFDLALAAKLPFNDFLKLEKIKGEEKILITGNEAAGLGVLSAGCKFYVAYPMTPATSILHLLAKQERNYQMIVKQAEDEIAVINMAIGASFAGVRSMCGTSGGGFALMNESLSFAGIAEIPLVIVLSQRPGPATGLPTWTGQGDLQFAINAGHGEFLRLVVAPGDAAETYEATINAFNLADRYQIPVIILLDKYLSESPHSIPILDAKDVKIDRGQIISQKELAKITEYQRYQFTENGISPRALPGTANGEHIANSDEHDEYGYSTESAAIRNKMAAKRLAKLPRLIKDLPEPKIYGNLNAKQTIICWGSTKMPALEALKDLPEARVVHLQYVFPFPVEFFKKNIDPENSIVIEGNQTGQLKQLIKQQTGMDIEKTLLKYDGRPFYPEEIIDKILNIKL